MLEEHGDIVTMIVLSLALGAPMVAAIGALITGRLTKLSLIPYPVIGAIFIPTLFLARSISTESLAAVYIMVAAAVLGLLMKWCKWPRPPFVMGLLTGLTAELGHQSVSAGDRRDDSLVRALGPPWPPCLSLAAVAAVVFKRGRIGVPVARPDEAGGRGRKRWRTCFYQRQRAGRRGPAATYRGNASQPLHDGRHRGGYLGVVCGGHAPVVRQGVPTAAIACSCRPGRRSTGLRPSARARRARSWTSGCGAQGCRAHGGRRCSWPPWWPSFWRSSTVIGLRYASHTLPARPYAALPGGAHALDKRGSWRGAPGSFQLCPEFHRAARA